MEKINIVSNSRSGSSYLFNLIKLGIDNDQFIYFKTEPFNENTSKSTWFEIVNLAISPDHTSILKNHYFQLENLQTSNDKLFIKLFSVKWKNILIIRKNVFEQALSLALAKTTRMFTPYSNKNVKLTINQKLFLGCLKRCINRNNDIIKNNLNIEYSNVVFYEDLVTNTIDVIKRLNIKDIKIENIHLNTNLLMQDKKSVVKNYNVLQQLSDKIINNTENLIYTIKQND